MSLLPPETLKGIGKEKSKVGRDAQCSHDFPGGDRGEKHPQLTFPFQGEMETA